MAERGSSDFQMSEVSQRCRMSKGSLYYYFEDRAALVDSVVDYEMEGLARTIASIAACAPCVRESLRDISGVLAESLRPGHPLSLALSCPQRRPAEELLRGERGFSKVAATIQRELERGKAEGLVRADADCHLGVAALVGALLASGPSGNSEGALSLVLDGLGAAPEELASLPVTNVGKDDEYAVA